jgi:hypothetical protein
MLVSLGSRYLANAWSKKYWHSALAKSNNTMPMVMSCIGVYAQAVGKPDVAYHTCRNTHTIGTCGTGCWKVSQAIFRQQSITVGLM